MVDGIINGMNVKIDRAGRIVLPKAVRDRLQLRPGVDLELHESREGILLRPVGQAASMVQRDGMWVHLGKAPRGFDWNHIVEDTRNERIKDVSEL